MRTLLNGLILLFVSCVILISPSHVYASQIDDGNITAGLPYFHTLTTQEKDELRLLFFTDELDAYKLTDEELFIEGEEEFFAFMDRLDRLRNLATMSDIEITFDATRSIMGRVTPHTVIRVFNFMESEDGVLEQFTNEITVGDSGIFSINVSLAEGENTIALVFGEYEDIQVVVSSIRRMSEMVKLELGNSARSLSGINNVLFGEN